ncbi:MAG: hypothetical protein ACHQUC_10050 [Chlamydiales bacterium]
MREGAFLLGQPGLDTQGPTGYESHPKYNSEQQRLNQNQIFIGKGIDVSSDGFWEILTTSSQLRKKCGKI